MAPTGKSDVLYSRSQLDMLDTIRMQFTLSEDTLLKITKAFLSEAAEGLTHYDKDMAMIPTFVESVPNGTEEGAFLAIDLGGTNLRVCEAIFHGNREFTPNQKSYPVEQKLKEGEATALFDYIAQCVQRFRTESSAHFTTIPVFLASDGSHHATLNDNPKSMHIPIAFTFSFPVDQKALDSGKLKTWTKGYSVQNAVGQDVVKLLQDAFDRNNVPVKCVALLNDTVGTLLTRAYTAGGCVLGAIFGTGTNGAYMEKKANISKLWDRRGGGHMIINTEWGAFDNGRRALPTTQYDTKLDRESIRPGTQAFEKFISGLYLGEITRNVILGFVDASPVPLLFRGRHTSALDKQGGVDTAVLSAVEIAWQGKPEETSTHDEGLERVRAVLVDRLGFTDSSEVMLADADIVRQICALVATRAARLSACAIAAILMQTGHAASSERDEGAQGEDGESIHIGVDGSLIEYYPHFMDVIRETLRGLVGSEVEKRVDIDMAKDGSGTGAALCALIGQKQYLARFRR